MNENFQVISRSCIKINIPKQYKVDIEKIDSIEKMMVLIKFLVEGLNITISENTKYYEELKDMLIEI